VHAVHVGCSGWSYRDWRDRFYPPGTPSSRWLEHYASAFDTVELNATFYRLPAVAAVRKWASGTPDGFLFAVKASRYLTHMRRLREMKTGLARFWERLEPMRKADKLGPILWQLPENFHRDDDLLTDALLQLPPDARHCFEFRHPSWFCDEIYALLEQHGASLALGHDARRELPPASPVAPFAYLRLHYGARGRAGNYSQSELETWRRRIAAWRSQREVFVYLNNDWQGFAPRNALYLGRGLS
jgi:uncharacterized protein YecE (DUF72 family)